MPNAHLSEALRQLRLDHYEVFEKTGAEHWAGNPPNAQHLFFRSLAAAQAE